ncbi:MAG: hypothetical protein KY475_10055 [Planctomycetes bacterium]|nr:hypothetical protein [Planctomycetota bacterium]
MTTTLTDRTPRTYRGGHQWPTHAHVLVVGMLAGLVAGVCLMHVLAPKLYVAAPSLETRVPPPIMSLPPRITRPLPRRTGYFHDEDDRLTLSVLVDYLYFLPENATEARTKILSMCEPLIPKRPGQTVPDFVRVTTKQSLDFLDAIPSGPASRHARRMLLSSGCGAPERLGLAEWEAHYEPYLAQLPADVAFLRDLPRRDGESVYLESSEAQAAIHRAIHYVQQNEPEPLPLPLPTSY